MAVLRDFLGTRSTNRIVLALSALALALLLIVNVTTFLMIQRTADFNASVEHTQQVRLTAAHAESELATAENAQRGFLLTGQQRFLAEHERSVVSLPATLDTLAGLTIDNADQHERALEIRRLAGDRLAIMQASMDLARQGRGAEGAAVVRRGEGVALTARIRREIAALDAQERRLLEQRRQSSEGAAQTTVLVNALAGFLILMLAFASYQILRRALAQIASARDQVEAANLSLEEKVRSRTGALSRANEEIQRFAYIVSHDLRAPLVNVMGYTSELEQAGKIIDRAIAKAETERAVDPEVVTAVREDMPEAVGFIRASTEKMDRLINAILKLSREGRRAPTPEPLDMADICRKIADSVQHQTSEAGAAIEVGDLPTLESDRLSIEQIFGNLIDNAVKYLDPARPGRISITGFNLADGQVEYQIADNGRGISDRDHERIFELFRRAGRQDRPGEGLGLAFVRNSVRRLGGTIDVESELGKGSTFRLKFPKRLILIPGEDIA